MINVKKNYSGFTLIELLVVIAIIALLLSILMPSLTKAKDHARRVVCMNNLKQQGVMTTMYMNDYKDFFPTLDSGPMATAISWGGKFGRDSIIGEQRFLNPYVGVNRKVGVADSEEGLQVFHCPADKGGLAGEWNPGFARTPSVWESLGWSYRYNAGGHEWLAQRAEKFGLWNKKLPSIKNPTRQVFYMCIPFFCYWGGFDPFEYYYWHNRNELGWAPVAFVDMHIDYLQATNDNPDYRSGPKWTFTTEVRKFSEQ